MQITKPVDLPLLQKELAAASVPVNGLGLSGDPPAPQELYTYDQEGLPVDLPPEAAPVVDAHVAPDPKAAAAFAAAEDTERLRLVNERSRTDPAFAALAELAIGKDTPS